MFIEYWDLKLLVSIYLFLHSNREEIKIEKGSKEAPKDRMRTICYSLFYSIADCYSLFYSSFNLIFLFQKKMIVIFF